jgi:hypothetical protein
VEEERLIEEARQSREKTAALEEQSGSDVDSDSHAPPPPDSHATGPESAEAPREGPWAKTSSGDAESITDS